MEEDALGEGICCPVTLTEPTMPISLPRQSPAMRHSTVLCAPPPSKVALPRCRDAMEYLTFLLSNDSSMRGSSCTQGAWRMCTAGTQNMCKGYLTYKKTPPPRTLCTVALCLGS